MYKKHLSEKIATVFFIAGVVFLIPTIWGMIPAVLMLLIGIFAGQGEVFVCGFGSVLAFAAGVALFIGYSKHMSGTLNESKILPLWFGTLAYNGFPLLMTLLSLISNRFTLNLGTNNFRLYCAAVVGWWIIATCLSLTAIYDEFERSHS